MKRFRLNQFWRKPKKATVCLFDTKDRLVHEKKVKLHTCKEKPGFVKIRDYVKFEEKDLGTVVIKSMRLIYEGEMIAMRRMPLTYILHGDTLEITWILTMESCPKLNLWKIK